MVSEVGLKTLDGAQDPHTMKSDDPVSPLAVASFILGAWLLTHGGGLISSL